VNARLASGEQKLVDPESYKFNYSMEVTLTAENAKAKTQVLYLTVGRENGFKKDKTPYYAYRDGVLTFNATVPFSLVRHDY
jgi:hypothetical protein